jgi:hypothetical protein
MSLRSGKRPLEAKMSFFAIRVLRVFRFPASSKKRKRKYDSYRISESAAKVHPFVDDFLSKGGLGSRAANCEIW